MKYIYKTATGNVIVELDESWHEILSTEDRDEFNQERRHTRNDHKYARGTPILMGAQESADDWLVFSMDESLKAVELKVDLEIALKALTPLQRRYFVLNRMWGYSYAEIGGFEGKSKMTICGIVLAAERKIKNFMK